MTTCRQSQRFNPPSKLALHPQFAAYIAGERVYPINVEISPSGICNATCNFCPFANTGELGAHRNVMLETGRLLLFLTECAALGVKSIAWTGGGEPSLHPDIAAIVEEVNSLGMNQGMFTNALARPKYNPARMDWIRITMTDRPYRVDYIKELRAAKTLGFAFNYSGPQDDDYLRTTLNIAEQVDADYVQVRPALPFHGATVDIEPPQITHPLLFVTEYKFEQAKVKHGYERCEAYHLIPFLWETGDVDVCSYMRKHEGYTLGNIYHSRFKAILDSAPPHVPVSESCQVCCRNHEHNRSIHAARQLEDVNFP